VSEPKYLRIHLLVEDPAGAVPSARIDTPVGPLGKDTRLRAACDPSVTMGQYDRGTAEPWAVHCKACKETAEFKAIDRPHPNLSQGSADLVTEPQS
jgi:hypothetical protein